MAAHRNTTRAVAAVVVVGLLVSVVLAALVSFYASSAPDGLEKVAQDTGFIESAQDSATAESPLADYTFGGDSGDGRFSVGMAGLIGVGVTALAAFGLFAALKPRGHAADQQ